MERDKIIEVLENHKLWIEKNGGSRADLRGADLSGADLRDADLRHADLSNADLDFSCWPLWCGSFGVKIDKKIFTQLVYHLCRTVVDDDECKNIQASLAKCANGFHRVDECGRIEAARKGKE